MDVLEFWPDYSGRGPLWDAAGQKVELDSLGLDRTFVDRLRGWLDLYDDSRLPIEGDGDSGWLREGRAILDVLRQALVGRYEVVTHEDWWGEVSPSDFRDCGAAYFLRTPPRD